MRTAGHSHGIYTGEYTDKARGGEAECSSLGGRELLNLSATGRETSRTRCVLEKGFGCTAQSTRSESLSPLTCAISVSTSYLSISPL